MADPVEKLPLHEVLYQKLLEATTDITPDSPANADVVKALLDSLFRGKMNAADAHSLAARLTLLEYRFKASRQGELTEFAGEVVADLLRRQAKKKPEVLPAGIPNFPHP